MSALGQERTLQHVGSMSAIPPKADIRSYTAAQSSRFEQRWYAHNSRARRQDIFSSVRDGRRAISAYLSRYLVLAESQKLSGWNCAITFTGASGTCSAIHSSTGYVQHST